MKRPMLALALSIHVCGSACDSSQSGDEADLRPANAASFIPAAPAERPSPRPSPEAPSESPLPAIPGGPGGESGGGSGSCGAPLPPPVSRFGVSIHGAADHRVLLDSTPLVGPDLEYCTKIGFTNRSICPVRPEGHPERLACEAYAVGTALDTGRVGPTWSANGRACSGAAAGAFCENHPSNQFQAFAYGSGTFRACARNGACGEIVL